MTIFQLILSLIWTRHFCTIMSHLANTPSILLMPKLLPSKESMVSTKLQQFLQLPWMVNFYRFKLFLKGKHLDVYQFYLQIQHNLQINWSNTAKSTELFWVNNISIIKWRRGNLELSQKIKIIDHYGQIQKTRQQRSHESM